MSQPIRYLITTDAEGVVRLSKLGPDGWGNIPMASDEAAVSHAKADAGGHAVAFQRKRLQPLPPYRGTLL